MALSFAGSTSFEQCEPTQWQPSDFGLDILIVKMRGKVTDLDTYIATLTKWSASGIDANMFLQEWPNDGHLQFPTVTLRYIGCKGGDTASRDHTDTQETTQSITWNDIDYPDNSIELTYVGPASVKHTISRTRPLVSIGAITPANVRIIWWSSTGTFSPALGSDASVLSYFHQRVIGLQQSVELVPNQYYANTESVTQMLFRRDIDP